MPTDLDLERRAVARALWDAYGYTLPDAPEALALVVMDALRSEAVADAD